MVADRHAFFDMRIGERIRSRRKALRMSQIALGQAAGVSYQQIQKYENGSNRISAPVLMDIADALRMEISAIFDGLAQQLSAQRGFAETAQASYAVEPLDGGTARRLREAYERISDPEAKEALAYIAERLAEAESAGPAEPRKLRRRAG